MDPYNMARGAMGFPVDYELGRALSSFQQHKQALLFEVTKNLVVKMAAYDSKDQVVSVMNGFFFHDKEPLILTSGHIFSKEPASFKAHFSDGNEFFASHELTLLKKGLENRDGDNVSWNPDLALFRCQAQPVHPRRPPFVNPITGYNAYVVGFAIDAPQLSFNDGIVSCVGVDRLTISSYAEPGFSGSPVLNNEAMTMVGASKSQLFPQLSSTFGSLLLSDRWWAFPEGTLHCHELQVAIACDGIVHISVLIWAEFLGLVAEKLPAKISCVS